ncbi:MAG: OmpA family protein [Proteobacteria bacterium]|nr:OmpA family protein [Pseudomonadota bacterium]
MRTVLALLLAAPLTANAAERGDMSFSLGAGAFFADQLDVLGHGLAVVPRYGYMIRPGAVVEGEVAIHSGGTNFGDTSYLDINPRVNFVGVLGMEQRFQPLISVGLGFQLKNLGESDDLRFEKLQDPDFDFMINAGPGGQFLLTPNLALRADYRLLLTIGDDPIGNYGDNLLGWELTGGAVYWIGEGFGIADSDKDGIDDDEDACPEAAEDMDGFEDTDGCPELDNDGDGIQDANDQCVDIPEDVDEWEDEDGCPDPDNDGDLVFDEDDTCPNVAGLEEFDGCPDTDGDGLQDSEDACPEAAGDELWQGCPDTDDDGVGDNLDKCPTEPGYIGAEGCPDGDEDRIPDSRDKCPDKKAPDGVVPALSDGCPARVFITKDAIRITDKIYFDSGRATIKSRSNDLLDEIAEIFINNKQISKVEIAGHTDSQGGDDSNLALSQARAEAVLAYLTEKGVEAGRLTAKGYGETKPIADNKRSSGRAQNRRVEFTILEQTPLEVEVDAEEAPAEEAPAVEKEAPAEEAPAEEAPAEAPAVTK